MVRVTEAVLKQKLFVITQGRKHHAYPKIHTNTLWSWKHGKIKEWIETKKKQFIKYKGAVREENDSDPETADIETLCNYHHLTHGIFAGTSFNCKLHMQLQRQIHT